MNKFNVFISWCLNHKVIVALVVLGMLFRLLLASRETFNFDMHNFIIDAAIFRQGHLNVFLYQSSYNYSPAFFFIIGGLDKIQQIFSFLSFPFIERSFISLIDLATLFVLLRIAIIKRIPLLFPTLFFFLNPISIIISGYHGQFDNIVILFLLLGVLLHISGNKYSKGIAVWVSVTIALIIKHIIMFQGFLILLHTYRDKKWKPWVLFFLSGLIFLLTFVPFYSEAKTAIEENVFKYQGLATLVGITNFLYAGCPKCTILGMPIYEFYKYLFMVGSVLFSVSIAKYNLLKALLLSFLFFLTFTSAIAAQYFVLPIAIGALFPSRWFFFYTVIVTLFLMGNEAELNLNAFKPIGFTVAWFSVILWFLAELIDTMTPVKKFYNKAILTSQKYIKIFSNI